MTDLFILLMMGSGDKQENPLVSFGIPLAMVAVLYFFMIRPQMKKAKQQKEFAQSNNEGDAIITIAGIHGKIVKSNDDGTIQVELGRNNVVKMERSAISMEMTKTLRDKENKTDA
jgi:preprotein translocase subunit YajC